VNGAEERPLARHIRKTPTKELAEASGLLDLAKGYREGSG